MVGSRVCFSHHKDIANPCRELARRTRCFVLLSSQAMGSAAGPQLLVMTVHNFPVALLTTTVKTTQVGNHTMTSSIPPDAVQCAMRKIQGPLFLIDVRSQSAAGLSRLVVSTSSEHCTLNLVGRPSLGCKKRVSLGPLCSLPKKSRW